MFLPKRASEPINAARITELVSPAISTNRNKTDVMNKKDLHDFFLNIMRKNIAKIVTLKPEIATMCDVPVRLKVSKVLPRRPLFVPISKPSSSGASGQGKIDSVLVINFS